MKFQHVVALILAASSFAALCQSANPFLGNWHANWMGDKQPRAAKLVITESGGSWQTLVSSKKNPCLGREAPIAIESSSDRKIVLKAKLSEAYPGCHDNKIVLTRGEDGTITGRLGQSELTLERE